ncbi:MAG TPA: SMP-30/gluconolactonase/LRE family protein [Tepidisphaeraceae bacterium]|jgi:enterochelin esterase family protein|nr:SMP-30/gluconolactonase/LRE family protein [Tepidisphaeraceae bacterium]
MLLPRLSFTLLAALLLLAPLPAKADDQPANTDRLSGILIPGEDWQVVADNLGFADGSSADGDGNLYFSDLKSKPPAVIKIAPDGKQTKIAEAAMSGTKIGPDARLYGCGGGKVVAFDLATGKSLVLAQGLKTNDLVVSYKGFVYITETGKHQVTLLDPTTGQVRAADIGITAPNGIALTPDQTRLLVSDYGGLHIYSFAIRADGSLTDKKVAMTMKAPEKKPTVAGGDGMTVDTAGRAYVTTALGLQIFDANGELLGILPKPQNGPLTNAAFAGMDLRYLYVTNGTKVYRRKTQAKGVLFFRPPLTASGEGK